MQKEPLPPDPGVVRAQFVEMTAELKELVRVVERHADEVLAGDDAAVEPLLTRARELKAAVAKNLDATDKVLAPTLATIDAWGAVRRERIEEVAADARTGLSAAEQQVARAQSPRELALAVRTFLAHVLKLVRREDREALRSSVLDEAKRAADTFTG